MLKPGMNKLVDMKPDSQVQRCPISSLFYFEANLLLGRKNIRVTAIKDSDNRAVEKLSASSSELGVVSRVVVDRSLGKHGKVLHLGLTERRAVGSDEDHLSLSGTKRLKSLLVSKDSLSRLHDELEARVHGLNILLGLLGWCHLDWLV
jgi:hypothetical protein